MRSRKVCVVLPLLLAATACMADDFSYTGTFSYDTDVVLFTFTVATPTTDVLLRTWSYAGGTNAAGQVIPEGGFQPVIDLYESDGTEMNPGTSIPCGGATAQDPTTGECGDAYYPTTLSFPGGIWTPGTYTVALTEDANAGIGNLGDGFFGEAVLGITPPGNWTCDEGSPGFQGSPPTVPTTGAFCDEGDAGVERTGNWALDIDNVTSASELGVSPVPEPASYLLFASGLAALAMAGWRSRRAAVA